MKKSKGFTLMELLVVITVLAILLGMALSSLKGTRAAARDSQRKTELEQVRSALEIYRTDEGSYPTRNGKVTTSLSGLGSYLEDDVLQDPLPSNFYYYYVYGSSGQTYTLCAHLETGGSAVSACGSSCGGTCNYGLTNP